MLWRKFRRAVLLREASTENPKIGVIADSPAVFLPATTFGDCIAVLAWALYPEAVLFLLFLMIGYNRIEAFVITEANLFSKRPVLLLKGSGLELPTKIGDVHLS